MLQSPLIATRVIIITVAATAVVAAPASAGLDHLDVLPPGGMIQACAGPATAGGPGWPGNDHFPYFNGGTPDLHEVLFAGGTGASAAASFANATIANDCSGVATLGIIQGIAHNDAPNTSFFAGAMLHGGWAETFVITSPGLGGQSGFMQFTMNVRGTLYATGFAGSSSFLVAGYKDANPLLANALFSPGNSSPLSTDRQYGHWAVATFGNPSVASMTVDDTITFAVPFVFGTPFKLSIYGRAGAGMRSSSGVAGNSTATTNFMDGLHWGGITNVYQGGVPIGNVTIVGASGIDWNGPVNPLSPADFNQDGMVDATDLAFLLGAWGTAAGDLNGDGTTDAADLAVLLGEWS